MEKVKYGGITYELVPGGFDTFTEGKLILKHLKRGESLEEIKETAKSIAATDSIDLLDMDGKLICSMEGYIYAGEIREIENYLIEEKQIPVETEEGQEPEIKVEEIRADVAMVGFRLQDVREELKEVKEVQDEILVAMLGGF
jgi:hypothetical protein